MYDACYGGIWRRDVNKLAKYHGFEEGKNVSYILGSTKTCINKFKGEAKLNINNKFYVPVGFDGQYTYLASGDEFLYNNRDDQENNCKYWVFCNPKIETCGSFFAILNE